MVALDFPDSPFTGQVYDRWMYDGSKWVLGGEPSALAQGPLLFQSHVERDAFYAANGNPPLGTRCFVRLCEFVWWGTSWKAVPVVQAQTIVTVADANGGVTWTLPNPWQSWTGGVAVASNHPNNPNVVMGDPSAYDATLTLQFTSPEMAGATWRWECASFGFYDGYLS